MFDPGCVTISYPSQKQVAALEEKVKSLEEKFDSQQEDFIEFTKKMREIMLHQKEMLKAEIVAAGVERYLLEQGAIEIKD